MNKKRLNRLVKLLCEKEIGKKQINAGQAREIIKLIVADQKIVSLLVLGWAEDVESQEQ